MWCSFIKWYLGHHCGSLCGKVIKWVECKNYVSQLKTVLFSVNPDELLLRMGEYDLNDEYDEPYSFQDRKVQIVASHPKFDPKTFEYDLALLRWVRVNLDMILCNWNMEIFLILDFPCKISDAMIKQALYFIDWKNLLFSDSMSLSHSSLTSFPFVFLKMMKILLDKRPG